MTTTPSSTSITATANSSTATTPGPTPSATSRPRSATTSAGDPRPSPISRSTPATFDKLAGRLAAQDEDRDVFAHALPGRVRRRPRHPQCRDQLRVHEGQRGDRRYRGVGRLHPRPEDRPRASPPASRGCGICRGETVPDRTRPPPRRAWRPRRLVDPIAVVLSRRGRPRVSRRLEQPRRPGGEAAPRRILRPPLVGGPDAQSLLDRGTRLRPGVEPFRGDTSRLPTRPASGKPASGISRRTGSSRTYPRFGR